VGETTQVLEHVINYRYAVAQSIIYYYTCNASGFRKVFTLIGFLK